MKRLIYFLFITTLFVAGNGCKKSYFDINDNPNSPTDVSITPELILPRVQLATASRVSVSYSYAARWSGYWTRSGTYGPSTEEESYNITTTFQATQWSAWYNILYDLDIMEKKAEANSQTFYVGVAKVLKAVGFMNLVDQYNNVPYSKAFDLVGNIQPAYDKGEDIYDSLLVELDEAVVLIKDAIPSENTKIEDVDIMFHADKTMWRKFANTLRLKLLLRQSQVPGFDPSPEIAKITADGSGFLGSGQTAYVDPKINPDDNGFVPGVENKQNPFWDTYELLYTGDVADNYNRANNYVLGLYRSNGDIRYQYFFDTAASPLNGNIYYGYNYGEVIPNTDPKAANSSGVNGPGLAASASAPLWFMTSIESLFMQAEAIQRGWLPGNAQTAYENAVTESFLWLGVTNAATEANNYLTSGNAIVDWSQATTSQAKINLIVIQQYLALTGIANFEAWANYRRLGVPNIPLSLAPSRGSNKIPLRLRYPQNEYNYNAQNVEAENNPDPQSAGVFWDK